MSRQEQATVNTGGGEAGDFRVGPNRPVFALTGAAGLAMASLGLLTLFLSRPWGEAPFALVIFSLPAAFFGAIAALSSLSALLPGRAVVVLDAEGIRDRSSFCVADVIRWDEIAAVSVRGWGRFKVLCIRVRHLDALLARQRPLPRFLVRDNWRVGGTPLCIAQVNVGVPLERLQEQIEARLARHESEQRRWLLGQ